MSQQGASHRREGPVRVKNEGEALMPLLAMDFLIYLQPVRLCKLKMRKKLALLQALAILITVFQYGMTAAGQDEGRYSNRILSNIFYPYLTVRYVKNQLNCIK